MIAQTFNPTAEFVILGTQTNEISTEIQTQPETVETKISEFQYNLNTYMSFFYFPIIKSSCFIFPKR